jgi:hypothetical protein
MPFANELLWSAARRPDLVPAAIDKFHRCSAFHRNPHSTTDGRARVAAVPINVPKQFLASAPEVTHVHSATR